MTGEAESRERTVRDLRAQNLTLRQHLWERLTPSEVYCPRTGRRYEHADRGEPHPYCSECGSELAPFGSRGHSYKHLATASVPWPP